MDITGASDPYVKIKLFDSKVSKGFIFLLHLEICLQFFHLFDRFPGKTHRQEEEDVGEVLQLEPLLERIIRLPYRRDGHEASVD